eukprot:12935426-Prorocentrum_lima.AAC.1
MLDRAGIDRTKTIMPLNMWLKRSRAKRVQHSAKPLSRQAELVQPEDMTRKITLQEVARTVDDNR